MTLFGSVGLEREPCVVFYACTRPLCCILVFLGPALFGMVMTQMPAGLGTGQAARHRQCPRDPFVLVALVVDWWPQYNYADSSDAEVTGRSC